MNISYNFNKCFERSLFTFAMCKLDNRESTKVSLSHLKILLGIKTIAALKSKLKRIDKSMLEALPYTFTLLDKKEQLLISYKNN